MRIQRKCTRSVKASIVTAAFVGLSASIGRATPLVFEDFNPPGATATTDLAGTPAAGGGTVSGEMGLTGNWTNIAATTPFTNNGNTVAPIFLTPGPVNGTAFVYPTNSSLPAPMGGTAEINAGYNNALYGASLSAPIPLSGGSSTYWFSYALDNGSARTDYDAQIAFLGSNTDIYAGMGYGSRDYISVVPTGIVPFFPGNTAQASGGSFAQGFSGGYLGLLVGELVTTPSGADTVNVKLIRYQAGQSAPALATNASAITWDTSYNFTSTDTVNQLGMFMAGVATPEMDALRVGTTYADAVGTVSAVSVSGTYTVYTGASNGNFDTSTQNFSFNGSSVAFANGNNVLFDDTATGPTNIVVTAGGVSPGSMTFNNASKAYNFSGGAITSPGILTTVGSGTITLSNSNSYTGGVNLSNGTLVLAAGGTLNTTGFVVGAGALTLNGGTLQAGNSSTGFITGTPINLTAGGGTIDTQAYNITIAESILGVANSPGGVLTKMGSGTLTLSGNSSYTGGTIVNAGTVNLSAGGGSGAVSGPLTINSGATVIASATDALGYAAGFQVTTLTVNAGGSFVNNAGNQGYRTNLVMGGGTVSNTSAGSFNIYYGFNVSSTASSTTGTISSAIQLRSENIPPNTTAGYNFTTAAGNTSSGVDLNITGNILGNAFTGVNFIGPGTLALSGSNTYAGGTNISGGTVIAGNPAVFGPVVDNIGVFISNGGKLVLGSLAAPTNSFVLPETLTYNGGGTLQLAPTPSYSSGNVSGGIAVTDASTVSLTIGSTPAAGVTRGILVTSSLSFASSTSGALDLGKNDLDINGQGYAAVEPMVASGYNAGAWNGPGINSSAAAQDPKHLMALGVIANDNGMGTPFYGNGGGIAPTFDGIVPSDGDVLVKYTYYGDANLDGKVDGSDYNRIDSAYLADAAYLSSNPGGTSLPATGWYNGDFNYDGQVNGSDYTLIDNAFNRQGAQLSAELATSTAEIAGGTSAVPEPTAIGLLAIGAMGLLGRARRHIYGR